MRFIITFAAILALCVSCAGAEPPLPAPNKTYSGAVTLKVDGFRRDIERTAAYLEYLEGRISELEKKDTAMGSRNVLSEIDAAMKASDETWPPNGVQVDIADMMAGLYTVNNRYRVVDTIEDWIASDYQASLAPGVYVVTDPIVLTNRVGVVMQGPSGGLMDPKGWGRTVWPYNESSQCIVCFDLPEDTPGISFIGCHSCTVKGINFCRTTPGAMIRDAANADDNVNSYAMRFIECGFYRRTNEGGATDPLEGVGQGVDQEGQIGVESLSNSGADNYQFIRCDFDRLEKPFYAATLSGVSGQCTKVRFVACALRRCTYLGHGVKAGGNVVFDWCTRYDTGPYVIDGMPNALSSMTWAFGWSDCSDGVGLKPLLDASGSQIGRLYLIGGNGAKVTDETNDDLVIPGYDEQYSDIQFLGPLPQGQDDYTGSNTDMPGRIFNHSAQEARLLDIESRLEALEP